MFKKGQLVRDKLSGDLFTVIKPELIRSGFVEVDNVPGYGKGRGLLRKYDLTLIGNNFKFKGAK